MRTLPLPVHRAALRVVLRRPDCTSELHLQLRLHPRHQRRDTGCSQRPRAQSRGLRLHAHSPQLGGGRLHKDCAQRRAPGRLRADAARPGTPGGGEGCERRDSGPVRAGVRDGQLQRGLVLAQAARQPVRERGQLAQIRVPAQRPGHGCGGQRCHHHGPEAPVHAPQHVLPVVRVPGERARGERRRAGRLWRRRGRRAGRRRAREHRRTATHARLSRSSPTTRTS